MASSTETVKSFQHSTADVPGYNDCPDFLFQVSRKSTPVSSRRHKISTNMIDNKAVSSVMRSSIERSATPPPPMMRLSGKKTLSRRVASATNLASLSSSSSSSSSSVPTQIVPTDTITLSEKEILEKINTLLQTTSSLPEREYTFYRKKIDTNIKDSLRSDSTRHVLSQFFEVSSDDRAKGLKLLREWMVADTTIGKWCPAFVKIFENIEVVQ